MSSAFFSGRTAKLMADPVQFVVLFGAIFSDSIKTAVSPRPNVNELDPELVAEYKRQIEEKNKELDKQFEIKKQLPPEPIVMP